MGFYISIALICIIAICIVLTFLLPGCDKTWQTVLNVIFLIICSFSFMFCIYKAVKLQELEERTKVEQILKLEKNGLITTEEKTLLLMDENLRRQYAEILKDSFMAKEK